MTAAPQKPSVTNPETAAYTKAKPRVRAYMTEHRAAVKERLVDQEADGLRKLNLGRDQILARLWELATLSHEATRGTIAGQIKALSMIEAIEGLIPSRMNARRLSPSELQPAVPPVEAQVHEAAWLRKQQHQAAGEEPDDAVAAAEVQPDAPKVPEPELTPEPAPKPANDTSSPSFVNPFINPQSPNWVPDATGHVFDTVLDRGLPQAVLFPRQTLLWAAPRRSIKSQILSNFTKYPARFTRTKERTDRQDDHQCRALKVTFSCPNDLVLDSIFYATQFVTLC